MGSCKKFKSWKLNINFNFEIKTQINCSRKVCFSHVSFDKEIRFPFELNKQTSSIAHLRNNSDNHLAFKVKTTNPKKYGVRPISGNVLPQSTCDITVRMQATQKEAPTDMQCKDKFLIQTVIIRPGATIKDVDPTLFNKASGKVIEEHKFDVKLVSPPQPLSPVLLGSKKGSSTKASAAPHNGNLIPCDGIERWRIRNGD